MQSRYFILLLLMLPLIPVYIGIRTELALINLNRLLLIPLFLQTITLLIFNRERRRFLINVASNNIAIIILCVAIIILRLGSGIFGIDAEYSLKTAIYEVIAYPLIFLSAITNLSDEKQIRAACKTISIALIIVCILGILEKIAESNLINYISWVDVSDDEYIIHALSEKLREGYRIQSTFYNPLSLAHYIILILPIALVSINIDTKNITKLINITTALVGVIAIQFTESRAGIILVLVQLTYLISQFTFHKLKMQIKFIIVTISLALMSVVGVGALWYRMTSQSEAEAMSSGARIAQLEMGIESISENLIIGIGPRMAPMVAGVAVNAKLVSIDNFYLSLAIESGLPILILFIWVLIKSIENRSNGQSDYLKRLSISLNISLITFAIFFLISSLYDEIFMYFAIVLAIKVAINEVANRSLLNEIK